MFDTKLSHIDVMPKKNTEILNGCGEAKTNKIIISNQHHC